jgi:hypothetical protein
MTNVIRVGTPLHVHVGHVGKNIAGPDVLCSDDRPLDQDGQRLRSIVVPLSRNIQPSLAVSPRRLLPAPTTYSQTAPLRSRKRT